MVKRLLTKDMLDFDAPDQVKDVIQPQGRPPETDPTLGIRPELSIEVNQKPGTPRHRLVTIGDSLSHGVQSGAIFNTDLSYPMMIAQEMGWEEHLRRPSQYGELGGLPLNLEYLVRRLEGQFGDQIDWWELAPALFSIQQYMDDLEDYWERGPGWQGGVGSTVAMHKGINHNLAIYGWNITDIISNDADTLRKTIEAPTDDLLRQIVENGNEHAALRVLDSARDSEGKALTPVQAAVALGQEGSLENGEGDGIETLMVMIGANNAMGSIAQLKVKWSCDRDSNSPQSNQRPTVWCPEDFKAECDQLVEQIKQIKARHVILATVPHVTIAPIGRGVGDKIATGSRYFPYYTRPWISDKDFDPNRDPHITAQQARAIDSVIDQYNDYIADVVGQARKEGRDWYLFELGGLLDCLAYRRYIEDSDCRPDWWTPYQLPPELEALSPVPDTRFFRSDATGRTSGGFFTLDGIHPTTIGYGIVAQEVINIMQQQAGVKFYRKDGRTKRDDPVKINFQRLIALDTLISDPPKSLSSSLKWLDWLDQNLQIFQRLLRKGN
ncbi:hypothetical protein BJP34_06460 [Moorena producens PAL-8-15-08-1]|uniref:Uncharacterized protein n=1 Tax=Moorena producens PAL-8-15-08-1 TaxID=1458985 RepID=A0A1D8TNA9_9CYAN|nr:hypothetical protein [Moorena producens]AOW99138.1 hypothetical protein BJP34_06460 [Moorena producens PAL-8-15-08-1]